MKFAAIVLEDPLSSGGSVTITEGFEFIKINGLNPAVHGNKVSCGCTLIAKQCAGKVLLSYAEK